MKKLITLLLVLVSVGGYSQSKYVKKITSLEELERFNDTIENIKTNFNGDNYVDSVLILLNEYRKSNGVEIVTISESLSNVAHLQSQYCADNLIVTHKQNEESLESSFKRGWLFGEYDVIGEIVIERNIKNTLIREETISESIIEGFKRSNGHSYIMKKPNNVRCGISIIQSEKDKNKYFTVIVFSDI
jgi:uncharacterized protein YkwD